MIGEIIATGDEIRCGALVDSNSAYIAEHLEMAGVRVTRHDCVGDDLAVLIDLFKEVGQRADVVLVTGGLGPTVDDLSAEAAAQAAGVGLVEDPVALAAIEAFFTRHKRQMNPTNRKQAWLPAGATRLDNPIGTAPGFMLTIGTAVFFFMPGVPGEMRRMLADQVLPRIATLQGGRRGFCLVKTIVTFGLGESVCGDQLAPIEQALPGIKLGLRAKFPEIHVKLYAEGMDHAHLDHLLDRGSRWVKDRLGIKVVSLEGKALEAVVGHLLRQSNATIALAESCTGGLIASMLTDVAGSSDYFLFSAVTYANQAKIDVLGVDPGTLNTHGAVSEETARQMAQGVRQRAGSTYGLAVSGIAGPDGGTPEKPVGTVCVGLAGPQATLTRRYLFNFTSRSMNKTFFAALALDLLRRQMAKGL